MNIVLCADDKYFYAGITMISILENSNIKNINFYILTDSNISKSTIKKFDKIKFKYKCNIEYIDVTKYLDYLKVVTWTNHKNNANHANLMSYYRILILKIFQNTLNKCIYIDSDMIINEDLSKIYDSISDNFLAGAVVEAGAMQKRNTILKETCELTEFVKLKKTPMEYPYFNAGFLIFNIKNCTKEKIFEQILSFLKGNPSPPYADQDSLNAILGQKYRKKMLYFDIKYNVFCNPERIKYNDAFYSEKDILAAFKMPAICHFAGGSKPWEGYHDEFKAIWWKYANISPWKKELQSRINKKESFINKIFSIKNDNRRLHKIITFLGIKIKISTNLH